MQVSPSIELAAAGETDEEFARRLQRYEEGLGGRGAVLESDNIIVQAGGTDADQQVDPAAAGNTTQNPNTEAQARSMLFNACFVFIPQIIVTIIIVPTHWKDSGPCDIRHRKYWSIWAIVSAVRMLVTAVSIILVIGMPRWMEARPRLKAFLVRIYPWIQGFAVLWFVLGNILLFSNAFYSGTDHMDDVGMRSNHASGCDHPTESPVYNLCLAMILINYVLFCAPCIAIALLLPLMCCMLPMVIRVLASLHGANSVTRGAAAEDIHKLPLVTITEEHLRTGVVSAPLDEEMGGSTSSSSSNSRGGDDNSNASTRPTSAAGAASSAANAATAAARRTTNLSNALTGGGGGANSLSMPLPISHPGGGSSSNDSRSGTPMTSAAAPLSVFNFNTTSLSASNSPVMRRTGSGSDAVTPFGSSSAAVATGNGSNIGRCDSHDNNGEITCAVCLCDFAVGDQARLLPCKHFFHQQCIDEWLPVNGICPTCRHSILPPQLASTAMTALNAPSTIRLTSSSSATNATAPNQPNANSNRRSRESSPDISGNSSRAALSSGNRSPGAHRTYQAISSAASDSEEAPTLGAAAGRSINDDDEDDHDEMSATKRKLLNRLKEEEEDVGGQLQQLHPLGGAATDGHDSNA